MTAHRVVIDEPRRPTGEYWWSCSCGDEGGPCESYNRALDSVMAHERREASRVPRRAVAPPEAAHD